MRTAAATPQAAAALATDVPPVAETFESWTTIGDEAIVKLSPLYAAGKPWRSAKQNPAAAAHDEGL